MSRLLLFSKKLTYYTLPGKEKHKAVRKRIAGKPKPLKTQEKGCSPQWEQEGRYHNLLHVDLAGRKTIYFLLLHIFLLTLKERKKYRTGFNCVTLDSRSTPKRYLLWYAVTTLCSNALLIFSRSYNDSFFAKIKTLKAKHILLCLPQPVQGPALCWNATNAWTLCCCALIIRAFSAHGKFSSLMFVERLYEFMICFHLVNLLATKGQLDRFCFLLSDFTNQIRARKKEENTASFAEVTWYNDVLTNVMISCQDLIYCN